MLDDFRNHHPISTETGMTTSEILAREAAMQRRAGWTLDDSLDFFNHVAKKAGGENKLVPQMNADNHRALGPTTLPGARLPQARQSR